MRLNELCRRLEQARIQSGAEMDILGITHDSREVKPGDLFVCLVGGQHDGHRYAADAVARGAVAVVAQEDHADQMTARAATVFVKDTRRALPSLSAAIYHDPSHSLSLIGVTGTNGKTTTTLLIASILRAAGLRTGTIGTLGAELMGEPMDSEHTTPEADQLQALLARMRDSGAQAVAMEVSSHALAQYRADACAFAGAAFTNLTQDHLDFHGSMEAYYDAKKRLFTELPAASSKPFVASINLDDPRGEMLAQATRGRVVTCAVQNERADVRASDIQLTPDRLAFIAHTPQGVAEIRLRIGGAFQVYNALAAIGVGIGMGLPLEAVAQGLSALPAVPGRFEAVPTGDRGFHVIVDYAHTPDGLENLLTAARRLKPSRLIVVFGCGGNRDRTKRPIMGRLAATLAEIAVVTSDNPRREDPLTIIEEIQNGMREAVAKVFVEPDRKRAIALALSEAHCGDIVLIAGKGHEDYQIIGETKFPFDDRKIVRELLGTA
jgi:UDP-N-acetylmuramoyl-L-alanyl-D-glutamate--2,6-diaminopimelate ligase